jgi:hypothetical protein
MPAEGYLLSVAHSALPLVGSLQSSVRQCFPDRRLFRQHEWLLCSRLTLEWHIPITLPYLMFSDPQCVAALVVQTAGFDAG